MTESAQILEAIKDQGDRQEKQADRQLEAISELATEMRNFGRDMSKAIGRSANGGRNGSPWLLLMGFAAIMFGLMAPMYITVQSMQDELGGVEDRMEADNVREREDILSRAQISATTESELAKLTEKLTEIETQFDGVDTLQQDVRTRLTAAEARQILIRLNGARMDQRLTALERGP